MCPLFMKSDFGSDKFQENILVVDDTPANLHLLVALLSDKGYRVRPVNSGELALKTAQANLPDLILLDVAMPGIDGYEVCRRLKAQPKTRDIPVIFISAHDASEDKLRAFEMGGVDYVSKPFQVEEVLARVTAHLTIRRQQLRLEANFEQLRRLEYLRDTLTHMVAHDMRSPLLALNFGLEFISMEVPPEKKDLIDMFTTSRLSVRNLVTLVNQMLDVSRLESGTMKINRSQTNLVALVTESISYLRPTAGSRRLVLTTGNVKDAYVDTELIRRVIWNLLGNAIKFSPASGVVNVEVREDGERVRIDVVDSGPGIDPAFHEKIFDKFGQVDAAESVKGYGLGLAFSKMAVESHGGKIGVVSSPGNGSRFWFSV